MDGSTTPGIAHETAPPRRSAPYLFFGQTTSLCETCLELVPAKVIVEDGCVFYLKRCREHGVQKTLIADDGRLLQIPEGLAEARRPAAGAPHPHRARLPL